MIDDSKLDWNWEKYLSSKEDGILIPKQDNLEYDLLTTEWIIEKVKSDKVYAQHLYAAMCNNDFMRNDVWPILTEKKWSCSWRHAGGVISEIRGEGDYLDWYCSGIVDADEDQWGILSEDSKKRLLETKAHVAESVVTDEIRKDLFKLNWIVVEDKSSD
jgi:hypothetical protein